MLYRTGMYRTGMYRTGMYRTGMYRTGMYRTGMYRTNMYQTRLCLTADRELIGRLHLDTQPLPNLRLGDGQEGLRGWERGGGGGGGRFRDVLE